VCCGFVFSGLSRSIFSVSFPIDSVSFCKCPPIGLVFFNGCLPIRWVSSVDVLLLDWFPDFLVSFLFGWFPRHCGISAERAVRSV